MAVFRGLWFMSNFFNGTAEADDVKGAGFADVLRGGEGRDTIDGGGGDDLLAGDAGNDLLLGGKGNDKLEGGGDQDTLDGGEGDDVLWGGDGNDVFRDIRGDNEISGGAGTDTVDYSAFTDGRVTVNLATGVALHQRIVYETFSDGRPPQVSTIETTGEDSLSSIEVVFGSIGGDILTGNGAANTFRGGFGDDTITGGDGADRMTGGEGKDHFRFDDGDAAVRITDTAGNVTVDRITDFDISNDVIDLSRIDADTTRDGDQAFVYANAFTGAAGQMLIRQDSERNFRMVGDTNGDGIGDVFIDFTSTDAGRSPGNYMFFSDSNVPRDDASIWL
jgi:serralysin